MLSNLQADILWKLAQGVSPTSELKHPFEEKVSGAFIVKADNVWVQTIDPDPATAVLASIAFEYTDLVLTKDTSVPNNRAWLAKATPGDLNSSQIINFIPPGLFGYKYAVQVFEDDGGGGIGDSINPLDKKWTFIYQTGTLVFEEDPQITGPIHIKAFRYTGTFLSDAQAASSTAEQKEVVTITSGMVTAKQFNLVRTPSSPLLVIPIGGTMLEQDVDFSVAGQTFNWTGLGLDGIVAENDKFYIQYSYNV